MRMHLQESGEMYLETIYVLSQSSNHVRSIDVAEHMGYSKPSVSRAMGLLKQGGYVIVDEDGFLVLTEEGRNMAQKAKKFRCTSCFRSTAPIWPHWTRMICCRSPAHTL